MSLSNELQIFVNTGTIKIISRQITKNKNEVIVNAEGYYNFGNKIFSITPCNQIPKTFPPDKDYMAFVSLSKINFTLRTRRNGDIFEPIGLNGHQKIKKYLNEKKIPQYQKDSLMFLADGNEILWIPGVGLSDKIKVTSNVTHVIKLYERAENEQN